MRVEIWGLNCFLKRLQLITLSLASLIPTFRVPCAISSWVLGEFFWVSYTDSRYFPLLRLQVSQVNWGLYFNTEAFCFQVLQLVLFPISYFFFLRCDLFPYVWEDSKHIYLSLDVPFFLITVFSFKYLNIIKITLLLLVFDNSIIYIISGSVSMVCFSPGYRLHFPAFCYV